MVAKVVLKMRQTLGGFVCSPSGDDSFLFQHVDEEAFRWEAEHLWCASVHKGRKLYNSMAAYWPSSTALAAAPMNQIPKAVFSKTLKEASWGPASILRGDLGDEVTKLRQSSNKEVFVHGGASFAQSIVSADLVVKYRLLIHPVTLGSGMRCIATPVQLRLISTY